MKINVRICVSKWLGGQYPGYLRYHGYFAYHGYLGWRSKVKFWLTSQNCYVMRISANLFAYMTTPSELSIYVSEPQTSRARRSANHSSALLFITVFWLPWLFWGTADGEPVFSVRVMHRIYLRPSPRLGEMTGSDGDKCEIGSLLGCCSVESDVLKVRTASIIRVPLKRRSVITRLHSATFQKTVFIKTPFERLSIMRRCQVVARLHCVQKASLFDTWPKHDL
jgi:hypothetical protein